MTATGQEYTVAVKWRGGRDWGWNGTDRFCGLSEAEAEGLYAIYRNLPQVRDVTVQKLWGGV